MADQQTNADEETNMAENQTVSMFNFERDFIQTESWFYQARVLISTKLLEGYSEKEMIKHAEPLIEEAISMQRWHDVFYQIEKRALIRQDDSPVDDDALWDFWNRMIYDINKRGEPYYEHPEGAPPLMDEAEPGSAGDVGEMTNATATLRKRLEKFGVFYQKGGFWAVFLAEA